MTKFIVFVDTNVFIHPRDLKDLPWREVFEGAQEIEIMVSAVVIGELDKHKASQSRRRLRDRSRKALKTIEEASSGPGESIILRDANPLVRLTLHDSDRIDWVAYPKLDPSIADDRLVADAAAFDGECSLLTHDSGPLIKARRHGVHCVSPPDHWALPPEETEDEKKVRRLERELASVRSTVPDITLELPQLALDEDTISLIVPQLPPLPGETIQALIEQCIRDNPPHEVGHLLAGSRFTPGLSIYGTGSFEAEQYQKDYGRFRSQVREHFKRFHEVVHLAAHAQRFEFLVINNSSVTAKGLRLGFFQESDFVFQGSEEDCRKVGSGIAPPLAPEAPRPSSLARFDALSYLPSTPKPRDPTGFYWVDYPDMDATEVALQCEDFRAKEQFASDIWLWAYAAVPTSGEVTVRVTASNLTEPIERNFTVEFKEREASWTDQNVLSLLPKDIATVIQARG